MQVSNSLNNVIRILFNPKVEAFRLFDFLVVKSNSDRYIAQIIEIYDDKFDASQNVARLKLFYKISTDDEVMPYDNFTPNKECEIIKIKQEEIENFLNNDKETFVFGNNRKTSQPLNIQYDFFNNNAVIISDKIETGNAISLALAKKLSAKKHSVIIDSTGIIEFEEAKKITALQDFKMPLNSLTIDFIFDKCLADASLEFQVKCGEILNEIKRFAKTQEGEFIPFKTFIKVLNEQYEATPFEELKLLIFRLTKLQIDGIFASSKKEYETLFNTINQNEVIIVDLSRADVFWQKAYLEYIIDGIQDEIYLITRINDENCDIDLLNKIYCKKQNIKFVPNVSYNYKKLPSVVQYCKNYVLLQSLYQRNDFLNANFALVNMLADDCIVFGENTDNFLYLATDFELKIEEKKKEYRKIALSLLDDDETEKIEILDDKEIQKTDSQKFIEELEKFDNERNVAKKEENETLKDEAEPKTAQIIQEVENSDYFEGLVDSNKSEETAQIEISTDDSEEFISNSTPVSAVLSSDMIEQQPEEEIVTEEDGDNDDIEIIEDNAVVAGEEENSEEQNQYDIEIDTSDDESTDAQNIETVNNINTDKSDDNSVVEEHQEEIELSDDELDFFQMAKESAEVEEKQQPQQNNNTESDENSEDIDIDIDLGEIADNSINNSFEEIINKKASEKSSDIVVNEEVKIDSKLVKSSENEENLPIFKEEISKSDEETSFKEGDKIRHKKYGVGTIIKAIQYEQRQLVQVEFETSGKILLDPKIAEIKLEY